MKIDDINANNDITKGLKNQILQLITSLQQKIITNLPAGNSLVVNSDTNKKARTISAAAFGVSYKTRSEEGTNCLILSSSNQNAGTIYQEISKSCPPELTSAVMDEQAEAQQKKAVLDKGPDILVATPGTLQKTARKMRHIFHNVHCIILDELNEMTSEEHHHNLKRIRLRILSDYSSLIFASNLNEQVKEAATPFTQDPIVVGFPESTESRMESSHALASDLKQQYINVPPRMKISTMMALIEQSSNGKTVIYTASKRGSNRLYKVLRKQNLQASSIHGKLSNKKKAQRLEKFTDGKASYLIIADISASELDLGKLDRVINYDVPGDADEYRSRANLLPAGETGSIISLVSKQDRSDISELQNELKSSLTKLDLPDSVQKKVENRNDPSKGKQQKKDGGLPRPSYDKLSGGRSGDHDKDKNSIVQVFKKLFTS